VTPKSLWALDVLIEEGYTYDSSIFPIRHDRYGIPLSPRHAYPLQRPGGTLVEAPASTTTVGPLNLPIAGGGYFRILPYGWTRWGISRVNDREQRAAIFYLHPWEIDPDQPRLRTGLLSRFRHYRNLDQTEGRLRQLLTDFHFVPLAELISQVEEPMAASRPAWALPYLW
jgi:polysaccharide deacetylase family protein (PEP-CTERM system associated)